MYFYLQCLVTPYSWLLQLYEKDWSRTYTSWTSPSCSCRHGVHDFHKFMGHWLIKIQKASSFIVLFGCGFTKYSYIGCLNKTIMHCFHFLYFVLKHRLYYLSVWVEYIDMWSCQWWRRVGGVQESHIFCSISLIFCSPLTRYTIIERKCFYLQLYVYLYAYLKNNVVLEIYDAMASAYI